MSIIDTAAARQTLALLRPEIAALRLHPELARELGGRLSQLASQITAACETAFLLSISEVAAA